MQPNQNNGYFDKNMSYLLTNMQCQKKQKITRKLKQKMLQTVVHDTKKREISSLLSRSTESPVQKDEV